MSKVTSKATHWIRQQGYNEENLPGDEYGQMLQAYEAGYREREKEHIEIHSRRERGATRIAELEKENAELRERLLKIENAYKRKSESEWRLSDLYQKMRTDYANVEKCSREYFTRYRVMMDRSIKAEEIIKTFLGFAEAFGYSPSMDKFITEAEQFLKEN